MKFRGGVFSGNGKVAAQDLALCFLLGAGDMDYRDTRVLSFQPDRIHLQSIVRSARHRDIAPVTGLEPDCDRAVCVGGGMASTEAAEPDSLADEMQRLSSVHGIWGTTAGCSQQSNPGGPNGLRLEP